VVDWDQFSNAFMGKACRPSMGKQRVLPGCLAARLQISDTLLGAVCEEFEQASISLVRMGTRRRSGSKLYRCRAVVEVQAETPEVAHEFVRSIAMNFDDILIETLNLGVPD